MKEIDFRALGLPIVSWIFFSKWTNKVHCDYSQILDLMGIFFSFQLLYGFISVELSQVVTSHLIRDILLCSQISFTICCDLEKKRMIRDNSIKYWWVRTLGSLILEPPSSKIGIMLLGTEYKWQPFRGWLHKAYFKRIGF